MYLRGIQNRSRCLGSWLSSSALQRTPCRKDNGTPSVCFSLAIVKQGPKATWGRSSSFALQVPCRPLSRDARATCRQALEAGPWSSAVNRPACSLAHGQRLSPPGLWVCIIQDCFQAPFIYLQISYVDFFLSSGIKCQSLHSREDT